MKKTLLFSAAILLLQCGAARAAAPVPVTSPVAVTVPAPAKPLVPVVLKDPPAGFAGRFLDSHFAQSVNDWRTASRYLDEVLAKDSQAPDLVKRAMILQMGAGDLSRAAAQAQILMKSGNQDGLAVMIVALNDFAQDRPQDVPTILKKMPPGDVTEFVRPLLLGWAQAGLGTLDTEGLAANGVHLYNGALMALYLHKKPEAEAFAQRLLTANPSTLYDAERAGDIFAALGDKDKALKIYGTLQAQAGASSTLTRKMAAVTADKDLKAVLPALEIATVKQGAAGAVFDLARILFEQRSDATAQLFANMALALDPGMLPARLLVASVLARGGNYDQAIRMFDGLKPENPDYADIEQYVADLMQKGGHDDQALTLLERLYAQGHDLDTLIRIGDLQRVEGKYADALKTYNRAIAQLGGKVPANYWYLLYARGMTFEQQGDWPKAEADLQAALASHPDEPYVLNYLAYGWAERGTHYTEALAMAQKAARLKPDDGFIADSVGWIEFLMGHYNDAVEQMEKAVSLAPYDATLNEHLGDAYWRAGRQAEARYQWQRAVNAKATPAQKKALEAKIDSGLPAAAVPANKS